MACGPVLGHQGGDRGVTVVVEQGVVAHAQPQADVELGLCLVEQLGLGDGVAHGLVGAGTQEHVGGVAHVHLGNGPGLAGDGYHLEALLAQNAVHNGGLLVQTHAEAHSQAGVAHPLGKLHNLPQTGPAAVPQIFYRSAGEKKVVIFRLEILGQNLLKKFRIAHGAVFRHLIQLARTAGLDGALGAGKHTYPPLLNIRSPLCARGVYAKQVRGWPDRPPGRSRTGRPRGRPK